MKLRLSIVALSVSFFFDWRAGEGQRTKLSFLLSLSPLRFWFCSVLHCGFFFLFSFQAGWAEDFRRQSNV